MSIIKQLATYDGSSWTTDDIGANASNVSLTTKVAGQSNVQSALSKLCGTSALTGSRAIVTNSSGVLTTSSVTSTQLGYLDGVTSNIQTQINTLNNNLLTEVTSGTHDFNDYKGSEHRWIFFRAECTLVNQPDEAVNGWLEILPSPDGGAIKQYWHRMGSFSGTFHDQYFRIYSNSEDRWSDWESVLTSSNNQITEWSYDSTRGMVYVRRFGHVVNLNFQGTVASYTGGSFTGLATLPEEYRPIHSHVGPAIDNYTSTQSAALEVYQILTSGSVRVYIYGSSGKRELEFSTTYMV